MTVRNRALWLLALASGVLHAQPVPPPDVGRQNDAIERELQQRLREEQQRAREAVPARPSGVDIQAPRPAVPPLGVPCRDIRTVQIEGSTRLPAAQVQALEAGFAGRCLGVPEMESLLGELTKAYIDQGLVTTRAYLPAQDLRTGVLRVQVVEGTVERFDVDSPRAGAQWPSGAFPVKPGELLNLRDLEQGIDQINRLGSNNAQLDLQPGTQPGQTVVVVRNQPATPLRLFLTYDNLGTRATGRQAASATLSLDSLLGWNELFTFTHRESVPHQPEHQSRSDAFSFSIPWGWWTFSSDLSQSAYANQITTAGGVNLLTQGRTTVGGLTADRVVYRDQGSRFSVSGRLQVQDSRSWLAQQYLAVSSRQQTTFELAGSGFVTAAGGILNARAAFTRGIPKFGGIDDPPGLPDAAPHANFGKWNLDLGYNRRFPIGERQALLWSSQLSVQRAGQTLYGAQQVAIGGVSSVRGYLYNSLAGDEGEIWRNELAVPYSFGSGGGRVYVAYDAGKVRNHAPGVPSGSLTGVTVGATLQWRSASVEAFASRAAHLPAFFTREPVRVGVRLSYSL